MAKKNILKELEAAREAGEPIQIHKLVDVQDLLTNGFARSTVIHLPGREMLPEDKVAVSITPKGRAHLAGKVEAAETDQGDATEPTTPAT